MAKKIYMASPTMHGDELKFVQEAFDTNWIAPLGPNVNQFETELTEYVYQKSLTTGYCAALSAGTAGLHLAAKLLNIGPGDVVFCSDLTFAATVNPFAYEKSRLVFIDSEEDTWNMSPDALRLAFEKYPNPKAVVLVHLYGIPAKLDEIIKICREHQVPLIEDAAESLGASYKGRQTGTFGKIAVYSFNGNKIITTSGGGALISSKKELVDKARFLATQAREPERHYEHKEIGYNYRMSNVVAGIGRGQLLYLDEHIAAKRKIYMTYKEAFKELPVTMNPYDEQNSQPNFWLSCMIVHKGCQVTPADIMNALERENIESRPIWKPMHMQPVYADCDFISQKNCVQNQQGECQKNQQGECQQQKNAELPVGEDIFARGLCLPSDIKNTEEDMERIISIIKSLFE